MKMMRVIILTIYAVFLSPYECSKILAVFPTPSISHQMAFRPITQELAKRGHQVVVITTDPAFTKGGAPENLTEIDIHDLSYAAWTNAMANKNVVGHYSEYTSDLTGKKQYLHAMQLTYKSYVPVFEEQFLSEEVQKLINDKNIKFDLLILEAWTRPLLVLSHLYKAPVITISSFGTMLGNYEVMGSPAHPLLCPSGLRLRVHNLSLIEKLSELYLYYSLQLFYWNHEKAENEVLKKLFGPDTPTVTELSNNVDMMFLNQHPVWEGNWPVPSSVVHIGGLHLHLHRPKRLPEDLKYYLDESQNGVIYVSFGSNINPSSMDPNYIQMMINTFSNLSYDVLWKWDKDEMPGKPTNIKIAKWFPQYDLLQHPKIKLFITQGGLQSTDEAILAGVPLIGIPMLGDQWFNTEKYVHHNIGMKLDIDELTDKNFMAAITTVIEDKSYRTNVLRLRSVMYDQPQNALERAVWWTEHVIRHKGARHLRAVTANMSWIEYYEIELVIVLLLGIFTILTIAVLVIRLILFMLHKLFLTKQAVKYKVK